MIEIKSLNPDNPAAYLASLGLVRILSAKVGISLSWSGEWADEFAVVTCDKVDSIGQLASLLWEHHQTDWLPAEKDIRKFDSSPASWIGRDDEKNKKGFVISSYWRFDAVKTRTGWLDNIRKVAGEIKSEDQYLEALTEWQQKDKASPLGFDPSAWQDSSRQKQEASATGQLCTAGLIWLAVNALPLFPVFASGTAGIRNDIFHYPTWKYPLGLESIEKICTGYTGQQDLLHIPGGVTAWESIVEKAGERKQWMFATPA